MSTTDRDVVEALRVALKERDRLRKENSRLLAGASEPIAIVGMACRYPGGASSPKRLWELVAAGRDAITALPTDRGWDLERLYDPDPETPNTSYAREGGFLDDAAEFDSSFFDVSPRDAVGGDPQVRQLLEVSWEALEDAGIVPATLRGSQAGVFIGAMYYDYGWGRGTETDEQRLTLGASIGGVLAGRVAYDFGLEGPTATVDTACSSSLVALHLAAQALRGGECSLVLVGGATVLSTPRIFIEAARQRGLAADGRCKAFAEAADGVGLGEGVGMLVLERLADAERHGHQVLAIVRGSAVNQDGASNGPAAPNGPSQERVIRQALANAGLEPRDVDAVEAHGTGTTLGDPIEAGALLATYGQQRERPLLLGSVKSNIGHTQAAAGVAGVIKTVMAMREGVLPKTLHLDAPSSKVDWEAGEIELLGEAREWTANGRPRRAGVSSFGASGTNAHLILEEVSQPAGAAEQASAEDAEPALPGAVPLILSARTERALGEAAGNLAAHLRQGPELDPADVASSLATRRTRFEHRAGVVGSSREELLGGLDALAADAAAPGLVRGRARTDGDPVFLFPGYGSQWAGMALELIETSPVFARRMGECAEALDPHMDWPLEDILRGAEGVPELDWPVVGTPALFATMVSLVELWRACGVEPAAVAGHSQGELIAAHVAGGLSLDDAARATMARIKAMLPLDGRGSMAAIALPGEAVESRLRRWRGLLDVAALNGPASTVVSGGPEAIEELVAECKRDGIKAKRITGASGASHSVQVEALHDDLVGALAPIAPRSGEVPFHSTVTGERLDTAELDPEYWYRNLRQTVRLAPVIESLIEAGHRTFIEVSPHPVLGLGLRETVDATAADPDSVVVLGTLRRDDGGAKRFALSLAGAHAAGARVEWERFFAGPGSRPVSLPTYPFQRKRYWLEPGGGGASPEAIGLGDAEHPLLRASIEDPEGDRSTFSGRVSVKTHPWLADHVIGGSTLLPSSALVELALRAGAEAGCDRLDELEIEAAAVLPVGGGLRLQVMLGAADGAGARPISIHSRPEEDGVEGWTCNARGTVRADRPSARPPALASWPPEGAEPIDVDAAYDRLADAGLDFGPAFQGLSAAWASGAETFAELSLATEQAQEANRFGIHPVLLDAISQAALLALTVDGDGAVAPRLPSSWSGLSLETEGHSALRARIVPRDGNRVTVELADLEGAAVASLGLELEAEPSLGTAADRDNGLFGLEWVEVEAGKPLAPRVTALDPGTAGEPATIDPGRTVLVVADEGLGSAVARHLAEQHGARHLIRAAGDVAERDRLAELLDSIDPEHPLGAVIYALAPEAGGLIEGARNLHELTQQLDLSAFVVFTGLWDRESGISSDLSEAERASMERSGFVPLSLARGMALLDAALASGHSQLLAASFDRAALRAAAADGVLPEPLRKLVPEGRRRRANAGGTLATRLATVAKAEREAVVLEMIRGEAAAVLGHDSASAVDPDLPFQDLGFDSAGGVELSNRLSQITGMRLAVTLAFDYPSATELAQHLLEQVNGSDSARPVARRAQGSDEPIAIAGIACRYPGSVASPEQLWQLLARGEDAIDGFPTNRGWDLERLYDPDPETPHTTYAREGGFLHDIADFDAAFFGISPREAEAIDPQQRLLLEAAWESLEHAGVDPQALRGSLTGIFAGVSSQEYAANVLASGDGFEGYRLIGFSGSAVSGRVAYTFGLEGPAMTVDTACSSSLVAIHLAAQALRQGECDLALAGGVTVLVTPTSLSEFSSLRGLSPDGRCKAFAEAADGVGFAEGVGVLVLERLSDAERNGHRVLATIRGSAVNQDGASNGLTAPNGPSQERVIRQALANAGLEAKDVDAVEAHGTGTTLGDPIEAGALLATYGQERDEPLLLGSVKSNIGHTQAAAGVAGVIKTVMAMREGVLPKTLHLDAPSSKVDWEAGEIELLAEAREWKANGRPRRAGVSSFGASGTNAHLILEEAPEAGRDPGQGASAKDPAGDEESLPLRGPIPLLLSARSEAALKEQATRLSAHLNDNPSLELTDLAYSLITTRAQLEQRAALVASDREELLSALAALQGEGSDQVARGSTRTERPPVFLFPGQGAQHHGMALELLDSNARFAAHMEECEQALSPFVDFSLAEVLRGDDPSWVDRLDVLQPALFAVMVSLARLWRECGVEPAAVLGHSQGEITAAHIAGGLSLEDASRLMALRAKALVKLAGKGTMISVSVGVEELDALIEPYADSVSLAAINGPSSLVLSGDTDALEELLGRCAQEGVRAQPMAVNCAGHSHQIESLKDELLEAFAPISPQSGEIPFHSTLTGEQIDTAELDPSYWYRNLREAVRLEPAVRSLLEAGRRNLIEIGPHPVLAFALGETAEAVLPATETASVLGTLRRGEQGERRFALSLAAAHVAGAAVNWDAFFKDSSAKAVPLPTYPFQRKRYWLEPAAGASDPGSIGQADAEHPLLGAVIEDPEGGGLALTGRVSLQTHPWLADHNPAGVVLFPGTGFVELALRAGREAGCEYLEELVLQTPLLLAESGGVALRVSVSAPVEGGAREVAIHSRAEASAEEGAGEWACHARGRLSAQPPAGEESLEVWPPEGAEPIDVEEVYEGFAEAGFDYGPAFQGMTAAWRSGGEVWAEVSLAGEQAPEAERFAIHPALLDSALHGGIELIVDSGGMEEGMVVLPFAWTAVRLAAPGRDALRVRITRNDASLSLAAFDADGEMVLSAGSVIGRQVSPEQLGAGTAAPRGILSFGWEEVSPAGAPGPPAKLVTLPELGEERSADLVVATHRATAAALALVKEALAAGDAEEQPRIAVLTRGAVAIAGEDPADPAAAAVWGLIRSAQSEVPGRFALIDASESDAAGEAIQRALAGGIEEPQLALREGRLLAPRIGEGAGAPAAAEAAAIDPERTVLITGATGTIGSLVARHLVAEHGARHLLLLSRSGTTAAGAEELARELSERGAEARIEACDVSQRAQLEGAIDSIDPAHPLGAVFHVAGVLEDGLLESMDEEQLARVLGPKADAAWHLHELSEGMELSHFVLFSSLGNMIGGPGQGNYAAASAFLDALAAQRRAAGRPAISIAWGLWESESALTGGMSEADRARARRLGAQAISDEQGLTLLDAALAKGDPLVLAAPVERGAFRKLAAAGMLPPILRGMVRERGERRTVPAVSLAERLAKVPAAERGAAVLDLVREEAAVVLGYESAAEIPPERPFSELGFDSLTAVEMRNRLAVLSGAQMPITLIFDYPNAAALAGFLVGEAGREGPGIEDELGQLELALAAIPAGHSRRASLATHLRALAADLESDDGAVQGDADIDRIEAASDEELLEFIDQQMGGE